MPTLEAELGQAVIHDLLRHQKPMLVTVTKTESETKSDSTISLVATIEQVEEAAITVSNPRRFKVYYNTVAYATSSHDSAEADLGHIIIHELLNGPALVTVTEEESKLYPAATLIAVVETIEKEEED